MANLTGAKLASFTKGKKGTPYVYGAKGADGVFTQTRLNMLARMYPNMFTTSYLNKIKTKKLVGKVCTDCSGLISWYTGKVLGSSQLYSQAYARLPISKWKQFAVGTVVWKSGHVGVYLGDGKVAEAKGIDYGTIISDIGDTAWKYGLTFSWMDYDIKESVPSNEITYKGNNPYDMPSGLIRRGSRGEGVKWLQWELNEAGYNIDIDGIFGTNTYNATRKFQQSCKIGVDGICGDDTKARLVANGGNSKSNPYSEPSSNLRRGSRGNGVRWLQYELREAGYSEVEIDGIFGNKTEAAVMNVQKNNNLAIDGICGRNTRAALKKN